MNDLTPLQPLPRLPDETPNLPLEGRSEFAARSAGEFREGGAVLRQPSQLAAAGLISAADVAALNEVAARYAVAITPAMRELIDPTDPADPIARQFVPDVRELATTPDERVDPIGDDVHEVVPGLIHRYPDRVLLKLLTACAVYCRFCFRRETVGQGEGLAPADLARILEYIRRHPEIWEVILSGGDPLVASPRRLSALVADISAVPTVRILRIHSRVPVVAPERITPELINAIKDLRLSTWVAVHANHPRELTPAARAALGRLADAGIALVSQTVLLKGVNDDPDTLAELMRAFVESRVKPYYLHHPDMAPGTEHFRGEIAHGQAIMAALRGRLSGIAQPTYVLDIPGGYGKVPVGPNYVDPDARTVTDIAGRVHAYPGAETAATWPDMPTVTKP